MTPFFTRLKFALKTFFALLFHDRIPDDVSAALGLSRRPGDGDGLEASVREAEPSRAGADATATQVLAVLQRDGRLVDFLMEDIAPYADAQIGAAVRNVHAGCREAIARYLTLAPILDGDEGGSITVEAGTDAAMVKTIGNVAGQPPFRGVLRHRGWLVSRIELPPLPASGRSVVAPAEVEIL